MPTTNINLTIDKTTVGLSNVDNTSDANKPVSTATQSALNLKEDLSNKQSDLTASASKYPTVNAVNTGLALKEDSANKDIAGGYAGLDGAGLINSAQLPSIAVTDTFVVASQVAMLALTAETGDVAIRTDLNETYILQGTDPTVLADWKQLLFPTAAVSSVFGRTGVVTAQSGDYDTSQVADTSNKRYVTDAEKTVIGNTSGTNTGDQTVGTTAGTVAAGNDARFLNRVWTFAKDASIGAPSSGTTNTISKSILIPANTISDGAVIRVRSFCEKVGVLSTCVHRFYINSTNDLTAPNLIGTQGSTAANFIGGARTLIVRSATETLTGSPTSNINDDEAAAGTSAAPQILNIDWTIDQYIIIACQTASASDTMFNNYLHVEFS